MPRPHRRRNAVVDNNDGSGVPTAASTGTAPPDYQLSLDMWDQNFSSAGVWSAQADITLVDGESFLLPLEIEDNNLSEDAQTVVWKIPASESGYGFTQNTYTFSESDGMGFIEVGPTGTYRQVVITINDNDVIDQTLNGDATENELSSSNGNDAIYGEAGNDTLYGGAGNDILNGGLGSDAMFGGAGNDTYIVDDPRDTATEYPNQGVDTVKSSVSFTLQERIDNLFLTNYAAINGTGNALNNKIVGYSSDNILSGREGNDILLGDYGDDSLYGEDGEDSLYGEFQDDYLYGGSGEDYLNGGDGDDYLYGEADNDILDGWTGNDFLSGDTGNDTLFGDVGNDSLYGGNGNDTLVSEDGDDYLDGYGWGTEFDTLTGGAGADTFVLGSYWSNVYYVEDGAGYATITDWEASIDSIQLSGSSSDYRLEFQTNWVGTSAYDTGIYYTGGTGSEELIGVVQDTTNLDISQFTFV